MKKISITILALITVLVSCKKVPEVNLKYVDVERDLITVGTTTATVQCDYQYIATLKKAYFYYGEGENEADMNTAEMHVVQNTLYVDLADLKPNTLYSYYYEFYNGFNSMRTVVKTFKTESLPIALPTVVTSLVSEITTNSAKGGGEVTDDGGAEVTERGICWSTSANPTLTDFHLAVDSGSGSFVAVMDSLEPNTTYHVRAYAINEKGTAYGLDKEFTTISDVPIGAVNGLFSVGPTKKVYFSQGNLQYQASTNTWRFAEHQWDFVGTQKPDPEGYWGGNVEGSDNADISSSYSGWIDLFGWGTSGWDNGNTCYHPWDCLGLFSGSGLIGFGYGPIDSTFTTYDLTGLYANADWGVYNPISNGGNQVNLWRTLLYEEWYYLIYTRTTSSGIRYAKAQVNGFNGLILVPDEWSTDVFELQGVNASESSFNSNIINASQWLLLENSGAIFLPASGNRGDTTVWSVGVCGLYWSASRVGNDHARGMYFSNSLVEIGGYYRYGGVPVRLVQDVNL